LEGKTKWDSSETVPSVPEYNNQESFNDSIPKSGSCDIISKILNWLLYIIVAGDLGY
jgi:hypothetical protein